MVKNKLLAEQDFSVELIPSVHADIQYLRELKNLHREFFFYKDIITAEQQNVWFEKYLTRGDDYMFIVQTNNQKVGCMGIRLQDSCWDVYNVILGDHEFKGSGIMGRAFQLMLNFALSERDLPIRLNVLKNNPAIWWYEKNGFIITSDSPDFLTMVYIK